MITAIFVGETSCGFIKDQLYYIIGIQESNMIKIHDLDGAGYCPYSSLEKFLENWKII